MNHSTSEYTHTPEKLLKLGRKTDKDERQLCPLWIPLVIQSMFNRQIIDLGNLLNKVKWVWVKIEYPSYSMVNTEHRLKPVVSEVLNFDPYPNDQLCNCHFYSNPPPALFSSAAKRRQPEARPWLLSYANK